MRIKSALLPALIALSLSLAARGGNQAMTFEDVMKFRDIHDPQISHNGKWIAFEVKPDRGNGTGEVRSLAGDQSFSIPRGSLSQFSEDSGWVAFVIRPDFLETENAETPDERPKKGLAVLNLSNGESWGRDSVQNFAFSEDSRWIAYHRFKEEGEEEQAGKQEEEQEESEEEEDEEESREPGTRLVLRRLSEDDEIHIESVVAFAFSPSSDYLAYIVVPPDGPSRLSVRSLLEGWERDLLSGDEKHFAGLAWNEEKGWLNFLSGDGKKKEKLAASLWRWKSGDSEAQAIDLQIPQDWFLPLKDSLQWNKAGTLLFLGLRPGKPGSEEDKSELHSQNSNGDRDDGTETNTDPYALDNILEKRSVDVWHWDDPLIIPNQKLQWKGEKDRTYLATYHVDGERLVQIADEEVPDAEPVENERYLLATSSIPYQKEITWSGRFSDVYAVDLNDGSRQQVVQRLTGQAYLSPQAEFAAYFQRGDWFLYDIKKGETRNLTSELEASFADEDHDYPSEPPGYGIGGWLKDDEGLLVYDKYDIWLFSTTGSDSVNLTESAGRANHRIFRLLQTDDEKEFWERGETVLLSSYHDLKKNYGFYELTMAEAGVRRLLEDEKRYRFIAQAKEAEQLIFTREAYDEFPDLWVTTPSFESPQKLTEVNPQMEDFAWGTSELVEWKSLDGIPLQGVLIKPGNYRPGERYPTLVYFYRLFSQRLHEFNQPVVNHRPCFPLYASNGYAIFLPDVRFEVGWPGFSATKSIVPGVQKLIEMGIADPENIALHGHSWSGYQTAFVVTQTDIFKAAIAGAPVSNMTSAYSGIRWGSGLARQFQYEMSQSRIGGSLWEFPERYIENSPVFFADRIDTPLLILFGDEDGAVPWYQGIELYLALRRLEKPAWFLQYRGEPHHPQKYPNKLDWAMKMKQFLDHFLKDQPAPEWIEEGVPYQGE